MLDRNKIQRHTALTQETSSLKAFDFDLIKFNFCNLRNSEASQSSQSSHHHSSHKSPFYRDLKNTAELLVECLEKEGVRYVFGQLSEDASLIRQALRKSTIQFIPTGHARGAASMAHVYSCLTGQVGVCLAKSTQNILDLLPGVVEANRQNVPLVAITEQEITHNYVSIDSRKNLNLVDVFDPGVKWSEQIDFPEKTPETVHNAFRQTQPKIEPGQPGAVHINLPEVIAVMPTSAIPFERYIRGKNTPSPETLDEVAKRLSQVHNPLILVGSNAIQANVRNEFIEFATQLKIPVVTTIMAKGIFPETHPLSLGTIDSQQAHRRFGFDWADLVITVGCHGLECLPQYWNPDGDIPILHINGTAASSNHYYAPQLELVGDLSTLLMGLLKRVDRRGKPISYPIGLRTPTQAEPEQRNESHIPFKPQTLTQVLRSVLQSDDILFSDTGVHQNWLIHDYPCELPNTCLNFHESSSAGLAISGAIAAKLVRPKQKVVTMISVDGFMGHYPELEPARWLNTPFVTLICNPGGWYPNFVEIAKSMGFKGYRVTSSEGLIPTLKTALEQDVPAVIDCPVDYREHQA